MNFDIFHFDTQTVKLYVHTYYILYDCRINLFDACMVHILLYLYFLHTRGVHTNNFATRSINNVVQKKETYIEEQIYE